MSNLGLSEDVTIDDIPLAGIAFDIEDFAGTGELKSLSGFQVTPLNLDDSISSADGSIDILAVGHNTLAADIILESSFDNTFVTKKGSIESDLIEVKGDNKLILAGDSDDLIDAVESEGGNRIYAGSGDDDLILGTGDRLVGAAGNDRFLVTSGGENTITGGEGTDRFWIAAAEIPDAANIITDFTQGEDILGIAGLNLGFEDINVTQASNNVLISG